MDAAADERSARSRDDPLDLLAAAKNRGYSVSLDAAGLREDVAKITRRGRDSDDANRYFDRQFGPRLLGLFAESHLTYEMDVAPEGGLAGFADGGTPARSEAQQPSLTDMLKAALAVLDAKYGQHENDEGFFLLVEAGRIDHAGRANDAGALIGEMCAYDRAFREAIAYAKSRDDVLVVATSDHDTGGLSVGCCDEYALDIGKLNGVTRSGEFVAIEIVTGVSRVLNDFGIAAETLETSTVNASVSSAVDKVVAASLLAAGRDVADVSNLITSADVSSIGAAALDAVRAARTARHTHEGYALTNAVATAMNRANTIGWTSRGNTGVDVPLFAYGVGSEKFRGTHNNSNVGRLMIDALGVNPEEGYKVFRERLKSIVRDDEDEPT